MHGQLLSRSRQLAFLRDRIGRQLDDPGRRRRRGRRRAGEQTLHLLAHELGEVRVDRILEEVRELAGRAP